MPCRIVFCIFLFVIQPLVASEKEDNLPLSDTDGGSITLVHNAVNVISGDYVEAVTDISIAGPEHLSFQRLYSSFDFSKRGLYNGWRHNHDSYIDYYNHKDGSNATFVELNGRTTEYNTSSKSRHRPLKFNKKKAKGYTNIGAGVIGGCTQAKNNLLMLNKRYKTVTATNGFCSNIFYQSQNDKIHKLNIISETKITGNQFNYSYDKKGLLAEVLLSNKNGKALGWIKINAEDAKKKLFFEADGSDGSHVTYKLKKYHDKTPNSKDTYYISDVLSPERPSLHYEYSRTAEESDYLWVTKKSLPNGRFLKINYFKKSHDVKSSDSRINRVKTLLAPSGCDTYAHQIYRFDYTFNEKSNKILDGHTTVLDANNRLMHYGYTEDHRIDRIEKFNGNHKSNYSLYSLEKYLWDDEGSLLCRYIQDKTSTILAVRTFDYDKKGNVIKDSFYGNLKGDSKAINFKKNHTIPEANGCDVWAVEYKYSLQNLLLEEKNPNGKSIKYSYDPTTYVLKSKFILDNGKIRVREFYDYDENSIITCQIIDDGSSEERKNLSHVTSRRITRTLNSKIAPFGLPVSVEELYVDLSTGFEKLLNRTLNEYDVKGNLTNITKYDRNGRFMHSYSYTYDAHNNLILAKTPSGTIEKAYNDNDELIFERGVSKDSYKKFEYDFMGRLIHLQEYHDNGVCLSTTYSYDLMGNLISSVDPFGHKTKFTYDAFNRLIKTQKPGFYGEDGRYIVPTISQEYDIFGNITAFLDSAGCTTTKTFNVRGSPLKINYPDGSYEQFSYNLDGTLHKSIDKNGSYSLYSYDCFRRLLKKEHYSNTGEHLYTTTQEYNSFHKISESDKSGNITTYSYDSAGFLTAISKNDSLKEFEYDARLRLKKTKEWTSDSDYHATVLTYDSQDRIIEERMENAIGKVFRRVEYGYDSNNNKVLIVEHGGLEPAITRHYFDSHQKLVKTMDPSGGLTYISYDYQALSKHGQLILETTTFDLNGVKTTTRFSVFDKPESIVKRNSLGELIAEKEIIYDAAGNVRVTLETAMLPDQKLNQIITKWQYNNFNQLVGIIEATGSVDQKMTRFAYNNVGEKILTVKPDGTEIHQKFDVLGRLKSYFASDNSFHYCFEYNLDDQLITSHDVLLNEWTIRTYDESGRLQNEKQQSGLSVEYAYDGTGRPTLFKIPDGSYVSYTYDGVNLMDVKRYSKEQNVLYTHKYVAHNLKGSVTEEESLNGTSALYKYDLKNRLIEVDRGSFKEIVIYDECGNLTKTVRDENSHITENTYLYNDLKAIASERGVGKHDYTHDSLNNCVKKDGHTQESNSLNQLLKTHDQTFQYDRNGNLKADGSGKTYCYDALDRLVKVSLLEGEYFYSYDSFNRRISKIKKDLSGELLEKTSYLYAGQNEVGSYLNGELQEFRVLGSGKGAEIGSAVALELQGNLYVPVHDHNGNVVQIQEAITGNVIESYYYSAFGEMEIKNEMGNHVEHSEVKNAWGFSSKRQDIETGYINFGRRYYDAKTARWISPDPLGFDEGPNLYTYVNNRPVSHFDLYGLRMGGGDAFSLNFSGSFSPTGNVSPHVYFNASPVLALAGHVVQTVASHVIPVPFAREAVMGVAGFIGGQGFSFDSLWQERESKALPPGGRISISNHRNISINGILNWDEGAEQMTNHLVRLLGGQQVYHIYNASRGLMTDLSECVLLKLGFETDSIRIARKAILDNLGAVGTHGTLDIYAHSMGGLITARALEGLSTEQLGQINVYTFGSARIITDCRLKSAINIVSVVDPVPFIADPIGCLVGMFSRNQNVQFYRPKNYPLLDHCFEGGTYEYACRQIADNSKSIHGIN
jgi:RHS repeat-associated protein